MMISLAPLLSEAKAAGVEHEGNRPFLLEPRQPNGRAALLIHGFSASPNEMRPLGERMAAEGYLVLGVRLAGHGTNPRDLQQCRWQDWYMSAYRGYEILTESGLPIDLLAQSTGALIGLELALRKPFRRAALLSPFLRMHHPLSPFVGWLKHLIPMQSRELAPEELPFYYRHRPLAGVEQILLLIAHLKPQLQQIQLPALVLSASADLTVDSASGHRLYRLLGSPEKSFQQLGPPAQHVLSAVASPCFDQVWTHILQFLNLTDPA